MNKPIRWWCLRPARAICFEKASLYLTMSTWSWTREDLQQNERVGVTLGGKRRQKWRGGDMNISFWDFGGESRTLVMKETVVTLLCDERMNPRAMSYWTLYQNPRSCPSTSTVISLIQVLLILNDKASTRRMLNRNGTLAEVEHAGSRL